MKTDMSPRAVTMRLRQTSELRDICIALGGERLKKRLKKEIAKYSERGTDPIPRRPRSVTDSPARRDA